MHTSIRDFLLDENRSNIFYVDLKDGQMIMATGTLKLMSKELHFNMCNLESSYLFNHQMMNVKDMEAFENKEELMYACLFWSYHLDAVEYGSKVLNSVKEFMLRAVIFWMEVLGIWSKVNAVSKSMYNTLQWLRRSRNVGKATRILETLAGEIKKFGHIFGRMMTESTPHLYISGITFLPTTSLLQQIFVKQFESPANFLQGHRAIWPALEVSLSGHKDEVTSVAFSPDGTRIVSGSKDKSVRIWDADSGTAVGKPLQGHTDEVTSTASHIIFHPPTSTPSAISDLFPMLELRQNGWLVDPTNGSLILWIPPEYCSILSIPPLCWVISQEYDPAI
ncbi:hypothetical protein D9757_011763 [Collybiopsis confluens]|nr:hypothetical protein D9757_011763 [Collybiopsis confluens]